jgi:biopolymer transport protein ExbB
MPNLPLLTMVAAVPSVADAAAEQVQVDWFEEAINGGVTMILLGVLSVALVAFALERLLKLRRGRIAPEKLTQDVDKALAGGDIEAAARAAKRDGSVLGDVVLHMLAHRKDDPQLVLNTAGDLGARALAAEERRLVPFAVVAGLAPLLGLLGTMIGMIESFKLVEVYGDEGGASLLAGSISKALITTAAGLIIAIPAVALYHFFRNRTLAMGAELERASERFFQRLFLNKRTGGGHAKVTPRQQAAPAPSRPASPGSKPPSRPIEKPLAAGAS